MNSTRKQSHTYISHGYFQEFQFLKNPTYDFIDFQRCSPLQQEQQVRPLTSRLPTHRQRGRFAAVQAGVGGSAEETDEQPSRRFNQEPAGQLGPRSPFDPEVRRAPMPRELFD